MCQWAGETREIQENHRIQHDVVSIELDCVFVVDPQRFRELVSGRSKGLKSTLLRAGLRVLETPYALAMNWRNRRFDRGTNEALAVDVPVISVGNLTLGGTGKTPLVEWICRYLRERDVRVSIVSRGYGSGEQGRNDEALELELALPDVPHLQNPNRVQAAQIAIDELFTQLIVLDDGFQHRRLKRDLDIVLLDATEPFGYGHVFPRGTLREPLHGLVRADLVVLTRADMISSAERETMRHRVATIVPTAAWCEVEHCADQLISSRGESESTDMLAGRKVAAFCAIGNPAGFRHTLESLGAEIVAWKVFPDHHRFSREDVQQLQDWATNVDFAICTRKDLVKLQISQLGSTPLRAVSVKLKFLAGQQELQKRLAEAVLSVSRTGEEASAT